MKIFLEWGNFSPCYVRRRTNSLTSTDPEIIVLFGNSEVMKIKFQQQAIPWTYLKIAR